MSDRSTRAKRDFSQVAFDVVAMLTGQKPKVTPPTKRKADPEKMRTLGSKGGVARANKLSTEQKSEIARKAATARWSEKNS